MLALSAVLCCDHGLTAGPSAALGGGYLAEVCGIPQQPDGLHQHIFHHGGNVAATKALGTLTQHLCAAAGGNTADDNPA